MKFFKKLYYTKLRKVSLISVIPAISLTFVSIFGFSAPVRAVSNCDTAYSASNFTLGGIASDSSGTVTLTPNAGSQFGAIWNKSRVDLSSDFCVIADVYLGDNNGGADGLAFVMQPNSVAAGGTGGGLGYAGITPSFAVEYDTWQNSGDLFNDHVGLMKNGNVVSHNSWGVNAVDVGNIEDNQWHKTKIYWDSVDNKVSVWLDKNADGDTDDPGETLFNAVSANLEANFSGEVYWGFTAATGGAANLQQVRNITYTGVARTNTPPTASTEPVLNDPTVVGQATVIPFVVADDETTQAQWSFTKTSSNTTVVPLNAISISMSSATNGTISITPATAGSSTVVIGIQDADGSALSYTLSVTATPPSLQVTSLLDDGSSGTLRWAITQANATSGGIYDAISFDADGVITLTSALPQITQSLTVTGNGRTQTVIDGNNLYRPFNVASGRTLTISNMTLKQGQATNGGLIFNGQGTVSATNIRFTGMNGGSAVFNNNNGSTATYTNCTFDYLNIGIAGDYGSTPQLAAGITTWANEADSVFTNKTYVINSVFTNNTYGINNYRFTKIQNSQFTSNSYGANVTGLNRTQILDSTFTSNGIGIYHNSWIPTTFNMGTDNRLITGNTFTSNSISMYLDDGYNNGQKNQSWVTITSNSWDAVGVWVRYYQWNGTSNAQGTARPYTTGTVFAQSSNTFPDSAGDPTNLTVTQSGSNIVLDWDPPVVSGYPVERYAIFFTTGNLGGWGVATGNVGDANALNTEYTFSESFFDGFGVESGSTWRFKIRSDNDTYGKYSQFTSEASIAIGTPPTTTTSSTTTTTTTTTVPYQPVPDSNDSGQSDNGGGGDSSPTGTTEPPYITPEPETESTTATLPEETLPETEETSTTIPEGSESTETTLPLIEVDTTEPEVVETEPETVEVDNPSDNSTDLPEEFNDLTDDTSVEEIVEIITDVDFTEISDEQFEAVIDKVFEDISDTEKVTEVLTSLLSQELDKEQLASVMEAVFSEDASVEQMGAVVDDLLEADLSGEELAAVFDAVFDEDLSDEETIELVQEVLKGELDAEEFATVINAIFDEVVTDEVLIETFTAVLETKLDAEKFEAIVNVLESEVISKKQVAEVVTLIIEQEGGVNAEQATELATSEKVLESIDGEQATELFDAVVASEVSPEDGAEIVEAVQEAPVEVKEAFEEEINVFAGVFDAYVALGSEIDTGSRRTLIAATTAVATVTAAAVTSGGSGGGSGGSGGSGGGSGGDSSGSQGRSRREEEGEEPAGEISGPEEDDSIFTKNSIYKYYMEGGLEMKKFDSLGFVKKLWDITAGIVFTIAGSVVVYYTLSGTTQTIALASTLTACVVHYVHQIFKNDEE